MQYATKLIHHSLTRPCVANVHFLWSWSADSYQVRAQHFPIFMLRTYNSSSITTLNDIAAFFVGLFKYIYS